MGEHQEKVMAFGQVKEKNQLSLRIKEMLASVKKAEEKCQKFEKEKKQLSLRITQLETALTVIRSKQINDNQQVSISMSTQQEQYDKDMTQLQSLQDGLQTDISSYKKDIQAITKEKDALQIQHVKDQENVNKKHQDVLNKQKKKMEMLQKKLDISKKEQEKEQEKVQEKAAAEVAAK